MAQTSLAGADVPIPELTGVFNLRDVGGIATADGRPLATGRVFRSDGLHRVPDEERPWLHDLGIRTVIDLRTDAERESEGWFQLEGVEAVHVPIFEQFDDMMELLGGEGTIPADPLLFMYRSLCINEADALAATLNQLAEAAADGPTVFHCTAGKDRTGVVAALLLRGLGVDHEQVSAQHARSAEPAKKMAEWYRATNKGGPTARMREMGLDPSLLTSLLAADASTMTDLLAEIEGGNGGIDGYLQSIGATAGVDRLRQILIAG